MTKTLNVVLFLELGGSHGARCMAAVLTQASG